MNKSPMKTVALALAVPVLLVEHGFDRLMRQLQRFGNFALDPFEGHIVVPITHNHSSQSPAFRPFQPRAPALQAK